MGLPEGQTSLLRVAGECACGEGLDQNLQFLLAGDIGSTYACGGVYLSLPLNP